MLKNDFKGDLSPETYARVQPQATDIEEAILGAIMLEKEAFEEAAGILSAECFYTDKHQMIFSAFQELRNSYSVIDILTVTNHLRKKEQLEKIGGPYEVVKLTNNVASSAHIDNHCKIVYHKWLQRELIRKCGEMITLAYAPDADGFELIEKHSSDIITLSLKNGTAEYTHLSVIVDEALQRIEDSRNNKSQLTGAAVDIDLLDNLTQGFQPTDLIVIAARPGVGKSAVAGNLAKGAALHPIKPTKVGCFLLEMSALQWVFRILAADAEIDGNDLKRGQVTDSQLQYLNTDVRRRLSRAGIYFDDTSSMGMRDIKKKARKMVKKEGVGMVIIDYMQLISGEGKSREQEVAKISRELKQLAKELKIPIIALSQLNRDADGKAPRLSNLRESGAIEQDADMVIFLSPPPEDQKDNPETKDTILIQVAKYRNGITDEIPLRFVKEIQKIFNEGDYERYTNRVSGMIPVASLDEPQFRPIKNITEPKSFEDGFEDTELF